MNKKIDVGVVVVLSALLLGSNVAFAKRSHALRAIESGLSSTFQPGPIEVPATGTIEVAFSPNEGSEKLVVKAIDSATSSIRMLSYSFTSAPVVAALLRAEKRGVDVALVADYKENVSQDRAGKARAALSALVNAGAHVRTISVYPIHHDKSIVVDGSTVETGSFNFSAAAAHKNSENVLVMWNNPKLAAVYLDHWNRNWKQGEDFRPAY